MDENLAKNRIVQITKNIQNKETFSIIKSYFLQQLILQQQQNSNTHNCNIMEIESTISTKALKQYQNIYLCPITMEVMQQPYALPCQHTFELSEIRKVLLQKPQCPLCRKHCQFKDGAINLLAKQGIQIYKKQLKRKQNKKLLIKQQILLRTIFENKPWCTFIDQNVTYQEVIKMMIERQKLNITVEEFYLSNFALDKTICSTFYSINFQPKYQWGKHPLFSLDWTVRIHLRLKFQKLLQQRQKN